MTKLLKGQRGIFLIEVLVAGVALSISAVAIALMFGWTQSFIATQSNDQLALYLAQQRPIGPLPRPKQDRVAEGVRI